MVGRARRELRQHIYLCLACSPDVLDHVRVGCANKLQQARGMENLTRSVYEMPPRCRDGSVVARIKYGPRVQRRPQRPVGAAEIFQVWRARTRRLIPGRSCREARVLRCGITRVGGKRRRRRFLIVGLRLESNRPRGDGCVSTPGASFTQRDLLVAKDTE